MPNRKSGERSSRRKLDGVGDAPESGEPRAQGRSRGRVIDPPAAAARQTAQPSARTRKGDPRAAAKRDESGDTANEAWESGRQKAM